jgi:hypothetical protein
LPFGHAPEIPPQGQSHRAEKNAISVSSYGKLQRIFNIPKAEENSSAFGILKT